jgi:hypothetical protein
LVDIILGFGLDLVEIGDDFELVLGLGVLLFVRGWNIEDFFHLDFELLPVFFHFVESFLVDELSGGYV